MPLAGKRILINGGATSVVVPTSDGGALFVGGLLGTGIKDDDPPMQPQLWRDGKVTAMAGFEHELAAQAEDQEKRSSTLNAIRNAKREDILALHGWKETSVDNLLAGIDAGSQRPLERLLVALNIRHVGPTVAKDLAGSSR